MAQGRQGGWGGMADLYFCFWQSQLMVASLFIIYTQRGFARRQKSPCPKFEQGRNTNNIIDYGIGVDNSDQALNFKVICLG
jgi:hypothetical protein